jgi:hypothetical protein
MRRHGTAVRGVGGLVGGWVRRGWEGVGGGGHPCGVPQHMCACALATEFAVLLEPVVPADPGSYEVFRDDFNGTSLNATEWFFDSSGASLAVADGRATMNAPASTVRHCGILRLWLQAL